MPETFEFHCLRIILQNKYFTLFSFQNYLLVDNFELNCGSLNIADFKKISFVYSTKCHRIVEYYFYFLHWISTCKIFLQRNFFNFAHALYEWLRNTLKDISFKDLQIKNLKFQLFLGCTGKFCKYALELPIRFDEIHHLN